MQRSSEKLTEVSLGLEQVSDELRKIGKTISLLSSNEKEEKFGYWARMVKKINRAYFIFYVTAVTVFLSVLLSRWTSWSKIKYEFIKRDRTYVLFIFFINVIHFNQSEENKCPIEYRLVRCSLLIFSDLFSIIRNTDPQLKKKNQIFNSDFCSTLLWWFQSPSVTKAARKWHCYLSHIV